MYSDMRMAERRDPVVQNLGREIDRLQREAYSNGRRDAQTEAALCSVVPTILANVDNLQLSDADFRQFIRNTLGDR